MAFSKSVKIYEAPLEKASFYLKSEIPGVGSWPVKETYLFFKARFTRPMELGT